MKGDFTRSTFVPDKHYCGVRMQQGRVQLDADWNEQHDIWAHRIEVGTNDVIGRAGAPWHESGLHVMTVASGNNNQLYPAEQSLPGNTPNPFPALQGKGDFFVSAGRYYVDGILCENAQLCTYATQPALGLVPPPAPPAAGTYLIYLHVFLRHVTALDDADIREVALGGPDSATRLKTIWQVRWQSAPANSTCLSAIPIDGDVVDPGKLQARAQPDQASDDPCVVAAGAGYQRLQNQLYRVEIHDGGAVGGTATFKWSRDNGCVESAWLAYNAATNALTVADAGRDAAHGFSKGDWVELSNDLIDLSGTPGTTVQLTDVSGNVLTIDPATLKGAAIAPPDATFHPRVRRWESPPLPVQVPAGNAGFIVLEDGVEIKFSAAGSFRTGDYWTIPARVETAAAAAGLLWPAGVDRPPMGVRHHYAHLAIATFDGNNWTSLQDCRPRFVPVNEDIGLFYLGGDGQVAPVRDLDPTKRFLLPQPLTVGVSIGQQPLAGANVLFEVLAGNGTLNGQKQVTVATGADGTTSVPFTVDGTTPVQQVKATLRDVANNPRHLPLIFTARLMFAESVIYDPSNCADLKAAQADTVQKAIDTLCKALHVTPAISVVGVQALSLTGAAVPLGNDVRVQANLTAGGIRVVCSENIAATKPANRPVCTLSIALPWPATNDERTFWGATEIGFQTITLAGATEFSETSILWRPTSQTQAWLPLIFSRYRVAELPVPGLILARLHVAGNFVWGQDQPDKYLDGTAFGRVNQQGMFELILKSGDNRRAGNFDMWFWILPPQPLQLAQVDFINAANASSSAGPIKLPLPAGAPAPHFAAAEGINKILFTFNRGFQTAGIVPAPAAGAANPQSIALTRVSEGNPLIVSDLAVVSNNIVQLTVKGPPATLAAGSYQLTAYGALTTPPPRIALRSDDNVLFDGAFNNGTAGSDFTLTFNAT
jgi:hypothetical protein